MPGKYTAGGKISTTTVVGNAKVGTHAADGSLNIILDDATSKGLYHPSGAIRVNSSTGVTHSDASGAAYTNHLFGPGR